MKKDSMFFDSSTWFASVLYKDLNAIIPPRVDYNRFAVRVGDDSVVLSCQENAWQIVSLLDCQMNTAIFSEYIRQGIVLTSEELKSKLQEYRRIEQEVLSWVRSLECKN